MVLCGISRGPNGPWAAVALAAHPSSFARHAVVAPAAAEPSTRLMPLGRRLDRPSRRGRIGRAAAAIRAPMAGTGLRRSAPPMSGPVSCSTGIPWCWRPSPGGRRRSEAYACVWMAPPRTWRRSGPPAWRGTGGGPHRRLRRTGRGTWIAREGGPTSLAPWSLDRWVRYAHKAVLPPPSRPNAPVRGACRCSLPRCASRSIATRRRRHSTGGATRRLRRCSGSQVRPHTRRYAGTSWETLASASRLRKNENLVNLTASGGIALIAPASAGDGVDVALTSHSVPSSLMNQS